jgi:hypothetical protein
LNNKSPINISRRDAIKILAAAVGAGALANLPGKWIKPKMEFGVLPAHAQTSSVHSLTVGPSNPNANFCWSFTSTVTITPPTTGIVMRYDITTSGIVTIVSPAALTGTVPTDASGIANLDVTVDNTAFGAGDTVTVTWSFENPSDGAGSGDQVFTSAGSGC